MADRDVPNGYTKMESGLYIQADTAASAVSDLRHPTAWLSDWALGSQGVSGIAVSQQTSLGLSTYYACLRAIAEDCAKLPFQVLERLERGRRQAREHTLWPILHDQANDEMAAFTMREVLTHWALAWGNGYGLIVRDRSMTRRDGEIVGIFPIHPRRVRVFRDQQTEGLLYEITSGDFIREAENASMTVPSSDMLHLRGPSPDGIMGYSVVQVAAESMGLSLAAQKYGASFFGNSGRPSGVLMHPQKLSKDAKDALKDSWNQLYGGPANANRTAVLEEGMSWVPTSLPPEQAQFLATRNFQVREVCRWFRMPPHKIADLADAKFNNVEAENTSYVVDTLTPWLTRWEQEVQMKLLPGETSFYVRHNVNSLLRGDVKARTEYYRFMVNHGILSPNEVRELEEFNPYDAGDEYFMQVNMATVESIVDGSARSQPASEQVSSSLRERGNEPSEDEQDEDATLTLSPSLNGAYHEEQ